VSSLQAVFYLGFVPAAIYLFASIPRWTRKRLRRAHTPYLEGGEMRGRFLIRAICPTCGVVCETAYSAEAKAEAARHTEQWMRIHYPERV